MYQYFEVKSHATAVTYVPIVGLFAGGGKGSHNEQTLTLEFAGDVVSACTYGKNSSDTTVNIGVLGASINPDRSNSVTTPCEETQ